MTARLGATVDDDRTRFELWSPDAASVDVQLVDGRVVALHRAVDAVGADDTWTVTVEGVTHGDRYRFRRDGGEWLPDPASRWQPDGVHGASAVVDERRFVWTDEAWTGVGLRDTVLYELHVGTFTPAGTFDAAIDQLPRLLEVGVTTVELMPVAAFPGRRNWGYDGVFPFAVQHSYGGPDGLARFVDAAHSTGLAVVLDVVYNHVGPEGNVLGRFAPYFTDAYRTPWGDAVNVAGVGSDGVRRFFVENAVGWVRDFHLDGLRLDAVHAIVDPTPVPFVQELAAAVHDQAGRTGRNVLVTVESSANDPRIVRPPGRGGWGCDAVWNDDFHHALRVALTGERHEYYASYGGIADLARAWERRFVYDGQYSPGFGRRHGAPATDVEPMRFVVFDTNHDHVGNTARGERMLADTGPDDPRHRLAATAVLLSPFTPMLFMGEEYGETAPFPYFVDHGDPELLDAVRAGRRREFAGAVGSGDVADPGDPATFAAAVIDPSLAERGPHRSRQAMVIELLRLRCDHAVLTDPAAAQDVAVEASVIVVIRRLPDSTATVVMNFSSSEAAVPAADGGCVFDSADARWGGPGRAADRMAPWSARLFVSHVP